MNHNISISKIDNKIFVDLLNAGIYPFWITEYLTQEPYLGYFLSHNDFVRGSNKTIPWQVLSDLFKFASQPSPRNLAGTLFEHCVDENDQLCLYFEFEYNISVNLGSEKRSDDAWPWQKNGSLSPDLPLTGHLPDTIF